MTTLTLKDRSSGILLHPTSLPGPHGVGDLGHAAHRFADYLATAGQRWWQMLPVGPVGAGNSPYDSRSSFAGEPMLVSLELLAEDGLLKRDELKAPRGFSGRRSLYDAARQFRVERLARAHERFMADPARRSELERFVVEQSHWLEDYALFAALCRAEKERCWVEWERDVRLRKAAALRRVRKTFHQEIELETFIQFAFDQQWRSLRAHCTERGLQLLGDVPQFVAFQSADVWARPDLFHLDKDGQRRVVAGVPPDAFSDSGQLWGNPLYRWDRMRKSGYRWWLERLGGVLARFDAVRLDHFIGFSRYWEVPAGSETAVTGKFRPVPGHDFLRTVKQELGGLPFIAEDLGILTDAVHELRDTFELPGMRILQFAFDHAGGNLYQPHRYPANTVAYTGTHDNDTLVGWLRAKRKKDNLTVERALRYAGGPPSPSDPEAAWSLIRAVLMSPALLTVFPIQDVWGMGDKARMNVPGTASGNWEWRFSVKDLDPAAAERLALMCSDYER